MARVAPRTFKAVKPNRGIQARYRAVLDKFVDAMNASVVRFLSAAYKRNEPVMAEDAKHHSPAQKKQQKKERKRVAAKGLPATELQKAVRKLARRWQKNMNAGAAELANFFSKAVEDRSSRDLEAILERSGISVKFTMTPAQRDVLKATVHANVALIKSIPAKHFAGVEQVIMQGVQNGRDLAFVSKKLQKQFGITKRRAALIARDQNNKATSALTRARQDELGIREAIWRHSGGGKHPRRSHIAADGKKFDIRKGMKIDGEYIWPGELINCGCTSESVIPGI